MTTDSGWKSKAARVYEVIEGSEIGDFYELERFKAVIGDPSASPYPAIRTAAKWFRKKRGLNLVNVFGRGYRVSHPNETPDHIRVQTKKAGRRLREAGKIASQTDRTLMEPARRHEVEILQKEVNLHARQIAELQRSKIDHERRIIALERLPVELPEFDLDRIAEMAARKLQEKMEKQGSPKEVSS